MANVPLRTYINEIETIIEQKQTEEAIAHCRHILHTYPKNIDTYRMLGKAYLESQRYSNAADIFLRVLSAVPDDFVSHVGMSIIREDESDLDAAIWHMERAFEGQPYNAAIQGELRRLFGLRDGMEPPKVHLTRGALARMYVKGDLHQQAIAELRSAIAEDPQRFDLQISLAQMYTHSGQNAKAIDTCGTIINKLPYCLDANLMLAQLLETTDRSEEAEAYQKRVQELNPYQAYVGSNAPTEDRVPAQAVLIEQLIWDGGPAVATSDQPEWAASVGVTLGDSRSVDDDLPDWMSDSSDEAPTLPASLDGGTETEEGDIPEFMKDAGWGPSTGAFDESQSAFDLDEEDSALESSEAVAGDIPDWLQQMAPPETIESPDEVADAPDGDLPPEAGDPPDWLQETDTESEVENGGIPDWLAPAAVAGVAGAIALSSSDDETSEPEEVLAEVDVPDWLQDLDSGEESLGDIESKEAELPDWLQEAVDEDIELPDPAAETEFAAAEGTEMPDWLQEMAEEEEASPEPTVEIEPVETEDGEVPDWLAPAAGVVGVAGAAAAASLLSSDDEKVESAEAEETEMPDWLQEMADDETPESATDAVDTEVKEVVAEDEAALVAEIELAEAEEDVPDWLQEIGEEEEVSPEPTAEIEPVETEIPDWLQESVEDEPTLVAEIEPAEAEEGDVPDWLQEAVADFPEPVEQILDKAKSPDDTQEADEVDEPESAAEIESVEAEDGEVPDWLAPAARAVGVAGAAAAVALSSSDGEKVEPAEAEETEMPDWLQEMADDEPPESATDAVDTEVKEVVEEDETEPVAEIELAEAEETDAPDLLQEAGADSPEPVEQIVDGTKSPDDAQEADEVDEPESAVELEPVEAKAGEIPDWLQEMADDETPEFESQMETADSEGTEIPDWLQEAIDEEVPESIAETEATEVEIPEWIREVADEDPPEPMVDSEDDQLSDTLKAVGAAGVAAAGIAAIAAADAEPQTEESVDLPVAEIPSEGIESSGDSDDADAAMAWIESLASKQGVAEDELLTSPEERSETPPDWVQEVADDEPVSVEPEMVETKESVETSAAEEDETIERDSTQDDIVEDDQVEVESSEITTDDLPDWLQEIPEETSAQLSESEEAEIEDEVIPDWLRDISDEVPTIAGESEIEAEIQTEPEIEDIPEWLQDIAGEQAPDVEEEPESEKLEAPDFEDADAAMAWMESLAAKQGVSEDELFTSPDERSETPPDWVQEIASTKADLIPEIETTIEEETLEEDEIEEIPEWLSEPIQVDETREPEVEEEQPATEIQDEQPPVLDVPEFLQETIPTETEESEIEVIEEPESIVEIDDIVELEDISTDADIVAPDFEDADAAMAWMESLAAKQGVSEDELLSSPEERSETPPDWVQDAVQSDLEEPAPVEESPPDDGGIPDWILDAPETEELAAELETISDTVEADETQLVKGELSLLEETHPDDGGIPDWILDTPETEEPVAKPEVISDVEVPEIVEVSTSDIDSALTEGESDVPDFADADAAMAWLESLAAKQGVSEEELLTTPEERLETPPDWVQDSIEADDVTEVEELSVTEEVSIEEDDLSEWLAKVPESPKSGELLTDPEGMELVSDIGDASVDMPEADLDFEDADAAMAWLESLAAKQGISEEELLTSPEERREVPPDWVQDTIEAEEAVAEAAPKVETQLEVTEPPETPAAEFISEDEASSPTVGEDASIAPPSWISDGDVPEDDDFSWLQSAVSEEEDKLLDLNQASLIQLERLPGVGFRRAQSITAYREEHGAFTSFDDLRYVSGMDNDTVELLKARVFIEAPELEPEPDAVEEAALFETQEADDAVHEQQLAAQSKLNQGDISEAMSDYGTLIKKGQRLDGIIEDLNLAAEKFPEEVTIAQTLGDAYMQANKLQEALDAYTKAEGLLR